MKISCLELSQKEVLKMDKFPTSSQAADKYV